MRDQQYVYDYPRPAVTTDCVIFGYDVKEGLSVLLVERGGEPYKGCHAFPGGFMNMDENAETGALRELMEETGLEVDSIEQIGCFSDVDRDPRDRVVTVAFWSLVKKTEVKCGDEAASAEWYPLSDVPRLAFDHEMILKVALRRLKEKIYYEPIGLELLPEVFTLPQLKHLYESILGVHIDRRNFAKKMIRLGILTEAGQRSENNGQRLQKMYSFKNERYNEMKANGFFLAF